jgi:hypothetical protein
MRRRRRPALSCRECRRRKVRCDHSKPCAPCVRHKTQCVYTPFHYEWPIPRPGDARGSPRQSPESRVPLEPGHATASPERTVQASPQSPPSSRPAAAERSERDGAAAAQNAPDLNDLLRRIQKLEESAASRAGAGPVDNTAFHVLAEAARCCGPLVAPQTTPGAQQERQPVLSKPREWGRRGWITGTPKFATIVACFHGILEGEGRNSSFQNPQTTLLISQAVDLLRKCRNSARSIKADWSIRDPASTGTSGSTPLPRETSDEKVKLYFSSFESTYVRFQASLPTASSLRFC